MSDDDADTGVSVPGARTITGALSELGVTADALLAARDVDAGPVTAEYEAWLARRRARRADRP